MAGVMYPVLRDARLRERKWAAKMQVGRHLQALQIKCKVIDRLTA